MVLGDLIFRSFWGSRFVHCVEPLATVPSEALTLIFRFLARALEGDGRKAPVGRQGVRDVEVFRIDARAEGNEVWIGGWTR